MSVRIPADVERADKVIGPLTARQVIILSAAGLLLYGAWQATRSFLPLPVFLAVAVPVGVLALVIVVAQRDGVSLDRLLLAALGHLFTPTRRVLAPEGVPDPPAWATGRATRSPAAPLELPMTGVSETGVVDLGRDGLAAVAVCSTVNFALRTPAEQQALVAAFGRFLHGLSGPAQLLVRVLRLDLTTQISQLRQRAAALPHPALERAAHSHADFLTNLAADADLLHRQVLLVLRDPTTPTVPSGKGRLSAVLRGRRRDDQIEADNDEQQAAETGLAQRVAEAAALLSAAGITVTVLNVAEARAVLASACNPDALTVAAPELAGPDEVITTAPTGEHNPPPGAPAVGAGDPRIDQFRKRYAR